MSLIKRIPAKAISSVRGLISGRIADMPDELDFCESDCRKPDCFEEDFVGCARRKMAVERRKAALDANAVNAEAASDQRAEK